MEYPFRQPLSLRERFGRFFYAEEVPFGLAAIRIVMPLVLLCQMFPRWFHAREIFSKDGAPAPLWDSFGFPGMLPLVSGEVAVAMHTALIFALVTTSIGWCTRTSLVIGTTLYTYLNLCDSISTITKYAVIATHVLFLLSLSRCGAVWSVDAWLQGRKRNREGWPGQPRVDYPRSPVWPRRLIQLMIGCVYFGAAATKIHTPEFFSGDQMLFWFRTDLNNPHPLSYWLAQFPVVVVISAYVAVVFEMLFIFVAWRGLARSVMVGMGLAFHAGTWILLGLHIFPLVCFTIYFSFFGEEDWKIGAQRCRRLARRLGFARRLHRPAISTERPPAMVRQRFVRSASLWACGLIVLACGGVATEYAMDPYDIRRAEGPHELKPIDAQWARMAINLSVPIRPEDKLFGFQTGTHIVGEHLGNRCREYRHGQNLIAEATFVPPHEDLAVVCTLQDAAGRPVERIPLNVERERFRAHFLFPLHAVYPPGEYEVVLSSGGHELVRHRISLQGSASQRISAN